MCELTIDETEAVSGGLGPMVIIATDLALNALLLGYATWTSNNHHQMR